MSNETPITPPLAGADGQPLAGNSEPQAGNDAISLDEAKKLRNEAAQLRRRAKDAEESLKKFQDAQLSDQEKLVKERDGLKAERDRLAGEAAAFKSQQAAMAAGALPQYAEFVAAKIPADALADKKELDKALAGLKTDFPLLFGGRGSADGGAVNRADAGTDMNKQLRRAAGRA